MCEECKASKEFVELKKEYRALTDDFLMTSQALAMLVDISGNVPNALFKPLLVAVTSKVIDVLLRNPEVERISKESGDSAVQKLNELKDRYIKE